MCDRWVWDIATESWIARSSNDRTLQHSNAPLAELIWYFDTSDVYYADTLDIPDLGGCDEFRRKGIGNCDEEENEPRGRVRESL